MLSSVISDASALFVFCVFAQAGYHKLNKSNQYYYVHSIMEYFNLSPVVATRFKIVSLRTCLNALVMSIGIVELVLAFAMVIPGTRYIAAFFIISVLICYMVMMATQLHQGKFSMDCGCGGQSSSLKISFGLLLRNSIYILIACFSFFPASTDISPLTVVALLIALSGILINSISEQLISNAQKLRFLNR